MSPINSMNKAYRKPDLEAISIAPMEPIVQNISNPGGTVPPLDPDEG